MLGKIILGLIIVAIGFVLVWKTEWFYTNLGGLVWFEEHLHSEGGSRLGYKLLGLILIFIGFLVATDMTEEFFAFTLGSLIKKPGQ